MARPIRLAGVTLAAGLLLPAVAAGAAADVTADVEFTIEGTSTDLAIAFADGASTDVELIADGSQVAGALPTTIVSDNRRGLDDNSWNVQVSTGDHFWHDEEEFAVLRNRAHVYLPGTSAVTNLLGGSLTLGAHELEAGTNRLGPADETATAGLPDHSYTLVAGTSALNLLGAASYSYTPQMRVDIPEGQAGGTYTGTVTQTLSSGLG